MNHVETAGETRLSWNLGVGDAIDRMARVHTAHILTRLHMRAPSPAPPSCGISTNLELAYCSLGRELQVDRVLSTPFECLDLDGNGILDHRSFVVLLFVALWRARVCRRGRGERGEAKHEFFNFALASSVMVQGG